MAIHLSEKHGVNPTIPKCYYCQNDKNEILLLGQLPGDREAPRGIYDAVPCDECANLMKMGIICISIRDGETLGNDENLPNPYRTGGWVVVTEAAIKRWLTADTAAHVCRRRCCFIHDTIWDQIGLPRGPVEGVPSDISQLPQSGG